MDPSIVHETHIHRILETEIWKYLPIKTLQQLCLTNKQNYQIYRLTSTWSFLLKRDFDEDDQQAKQKYIKYFKVLNYFTPIFPICTSDALKMTSEIIPREIWHNICIHNKVLTFKTLSTYTILSICRHYRNEQYDSNDSDDSDLDFNTDSDGFDTDNGCYGIDVCYAKKLIDKCENWLNKRYPNVYEDFWNMRHMYEKQLSTKLTMRECFIKYASVPGKVYINKKLVNVNINLDLANTLLCNYHTANKRKMFDEIENLLVSHLR